MRRTETEVVPPAWGTFDLTTFANQHNEITPPVQHAGQSHLVSSGLSQMLHDSETNTFSIMLQYGIKGAWRKSFNLHSNTPLNDCIHHKNRHCSVGIEPTRPHHRPLPGTTAHTLLVQRKLYPCTAKVEPEAHRNSTTK
ncbi:unnamed protein product [Alternaria burnsii]|nr:unnamed protein product [Alternaria burnsii]